MLRRIPIIAFAVLLFAAILAVPIGRTSGPTQLEPVKILAAMFLPQTAAAQARDTLDTLGGATARVPVIEAAAASADSVAQKRASHSHLVLFTVLAVVAVACFAAWFFTRPKRETGGYDSRGAT